MSEQGLRRGKVVADKWVLERQLGEGSWGVVWAARPLASDGRSLAKKLVAIKFEAVESTKILRSGKTASDSVHNTVPLEHKILLRLHSGEGILNGVPVPIEFADLGPHVADSGGWHYSYIVMPLLEASLQQVRSDTPLTFCKVAGQALLQILRESHKKGVIHRDISPQNIMMSKGGDFFLMDWGLAKVYVKSDGTPLRLGEDNDNGSYYGTCDFVSERVLRGGYNAPRDDLESLILVLMSFAGQLSCISSDKAEDLLEARKILMNDQDVHKTFKSMLRRIHKMDLFACDYTAIHKSLSKLEDSPNSAKLHWAVTIGDDKTVPAKSSSITERTSDNAQHVAKKRRVAKPRQVSFGERTELQDRRSGRKVKDVASPTVLSRQSTPLKKSTTTASAASLQRKSFRLQDMDKATRGARKRKACWIM